MKKQQRFAQTFYREYYTAIYPDATEQMVDFAIKIKLSETDDNWKRYMASQAILMGVAA